MISRVDEEMLEALDNQVEHLTHRDHLLGYILARLNDTIAPRVAGSRIQPQCAFRVGQLGVHMGEADLAMERLNQALALYGAIDDRLGQAAHALCSLGEVLSFQGQDDHAQDRFEQALALYTDLC